MKTMNSNIIYSNEQAGILICSHIDRDVDRLVLNSAYPIMLMRAPMGCRFQPIKDKVKHPWQHKIIMDAFKQIGWPVKLTLNGRYYSLKNKKDRFRFKLKYGSS